MKKAVGSSLLLIVLMLMLGACNSSDDQANDEPAEPVEITIQTQFADFPSEEEFESIYVASVKARYPHIDLKLVSFQEAEIENLVVSGNAPDIMIASVLNLSRYEQLGLLHDLNPLIAQFNFDTDRVLDNLMHVIRQYSDKDQLYGIPFYLNFNALFYNKDLFDQFGVQHPRDGMYWDEVLGLARQMTREVDGIQYRGLDPNLILRLAGPMGVGYVNPQTGLSDIQAWRPAFELLQRIVSIEGNQPQPVNLPALRRGANDFVGARDIAMIARPNMFTFFQSVEDLNWDLVTYPQYPEYPGTYGIAGGRAYLISSSSKHKEAAFQVIETMLTDEVQKEFNRRGYTTALKSPEVQSTFGEGMPYLAGKNLDAIFKLDPSWSYVTAYDDDLSNIVLRRSLDVYAGDKDINTILRETEEEMNMTLSQLKER